MLQLAQSYQDSFQPSSTVPAVTSYADTQTRHPPPATHIQLSANTGGYSLTVVIYSLLPFIS
jgi:hypothetical protein